MNAQTDLGRVAWQAAPAGPAAWAPEPGPPRDALRSGERVSEPGVQEQPAVPGPARPGALRS